MADDYRYVDRFNWISAGQDFAFAYATDSDSDEPITPIPAPIVHKAMPDRRERQPRNNWGLKKFCHFPRLPIELRLRIWRFAIAEPRLVTLEKERRYYQTTSASGKVRYYEGPWEWNSTEVPDIMQVNREAYLEAKRVYAMTGTYSITFTAKPRIIEASSSQSESDEKSNLSHSFGAPLFLGPELDTVYIPDFEFGSKRTGLAIPGAYTEIPEASLPNPEVKFVSISHSEFVAKASAPNVLENLSTLSIDWKEWFYCPHPPESIIRSYFPNLKNLIMVVGSEENDEYMEWVIDQTEGAFEVEVERDPSFDPPELMIILDEAVLLEQ